MTDRERCKTCRFYDFTDRALGTGWCVRYPDAVEKDEGEWCGEYRADGDAALSVPLEDIAAKYAWSTRLRNCLLDPSDGHGKIKTVGALIKHSADDLLKRRSFGITTLQELQRTLDSLGVYLAVSADK